MVPTSSRETSLLLFENNKVKSRLLSNASSSRFDGSFLLVAFSEVQVVVRKKQPKFFAFLPLLQFFAFLLLLKFFAFLLQNFFNFSPSFCFEATPTTRRGVSFPPPLARTQTTTEPDREMKK
jgi:hypothetical protein